MAMLATNPSARATTTPGHVHFDDACVLIPDPIVQSRMPRLVKKSYSLPLWRKRSNSNPPADVVEAAPGPASPTEDRGMVITVSVPSFSRSRSLSRSESSQQQLVSCIVNANHAPPHPSAHVRRPSLPLPPRTDVITVPLRPCCNECFRSTEECLMEGTAWEEKFTRGARRLRNSSADMQIHAHAQRHRRVQDDVPGFGAIVSVDEIDKRHGTDSDSIAAAAVTEVPSHEQDGDLLPSFSRRLQISDTDPKAGSGAIVEEDEAELSETGFPLPSPRRTLANSPSASSSHLPRDARDDNLHLLLQAMSDTSALERVLSLDTPLATHPDDDDDSDEAGGQRVLSVYYTPDTSPAIPALEPSSIVSSPDTPTPVTPPTPHPVASLHSAAVPIPIPAMSRSTHKFFSGMSPPSFDLLHSPPSPLPPPPPPKDYQPRYSMSGSPDLSELPVLTAVPPGTPESPRKRAGLHMPHLLGAGSFFRAGAEILRGVGSLSAGTGPVPMSV